ncbi:hypothetical protein [Lysobacter sp. CA199]|uniref:hypothetical protein n=1 Tax=Lysobacter sp. CA199 TaxID=3455608 RepID=UPI003F8D14DC
MHTSIKLRRNWNVAMVAVPLPLLSVTALTSIPGVISAKVTGVEGDPPMAVMVVEYEWLGEGPPEVSEQALKHFGLTRAV